MHVCPQRRRRYERPLLWPRSRTRAATFRRLHPPSAACTRLPPPAPTLSVGRTALPGGLWLGAAGSRLRATASEPRVSTSSPATRTGSAARKSATNWGGGGGRGAGWLKTTEVYLLAALEAAPSPPGRVLPAAPAPGGPGRPSGSGLFPLCLCPHVESSCVSALLLRTQP